jgi:Mn-dependent DtxR family transcriptional regulator
MATRAGSTLHKRSVHAHRTANFYLLSVTGPKMPTDLKEGMEKSVTAKAEVIAWLKRSLDAVKELI